ncbi:MAG: MBL fold metallo-hydrolase [Spirochaetales bacterium]|nr:MBL fold metallo-hydrolase [Spirochaetales bacterium]
MLDYAVLASGSIANAYIFRYKELVFAVDNGLSCRQFFLRAEHCGFDPNELQYIFITHSHIDHVRGVELLAKKTNATVVHHHQMNIESVFKNSVSRQLKIEPGIEYSVDGLVFTSFYTEHDAPHAVSYSFTAGNKSVCIITDTGKTSDEMVRIANKADILFLEANYCPDMLANSEYPDYIKERIASDRGHLSNHAAVSFLNQLKPEGKRKVYFCHLSDNNNSAGILEECLSRYLEHEIDYIICPRGEIVRPGKIISDTSIP